MYLAVRVRGKLDLPGKTSETLDQLGLDTRHRMILVPETDAYRGRLESVKDAIAYGTVDTDTATTILEQFSDETLDDLDYDSRDELVSDLENGDVTIGELKDNNFSTVMRASPPSKGFADTKRQRGQGGSLGYWGDNITSLVERMA